MIEAFACAGNVPGKGDGCVGRGERGGELAPEVEREVPIACDVGGVAGDGVIGGGVPIEVRYGGLGGD